MYNPLIPHNLCIFFYDWTRDVIFLRRGKKTASRFKIKIKFEVHAEIDTRIFKLKNNNNINIAFNDVSQGNEYRYLNSKQFENFLNSWLHIA